VVSPYVPDEVWVERSELQSSVARTVLARLEGRPVRIVDDAQSADAASFAAGKRRMVLQRHRGSFLRHCPAGTSGLVCCNYLVVNLASNCPFDCSYCFLQDYLADNRPLRVFTNVGDALDEIGAVVRARPERPFRIGTGELTDSLALDHLTGISRRLVPFFAALPNATLELKTKSAEIGELLSLDPRGRVVVSWSVNAPAIVASEEHGSATLGERIEAARRVERAGYRLGFHFDPLIESEGWEEGYQEAVRAIFARLPAASIAWVSLGSLRLTPSLERRIRARRGGQRVLAGEMVPGADGKSRVWLGLRTRMYRFVAGLIRAAAPEVPVYLCMETAAVWDRVIGDVPTDRALGLRLASGTSWEF
jgi:spore photoproduct lyase